MMPPKIRPCPLRLWAPAVILLLVAAPLGAQEKGFLAAYKDPQDGRFDASAHLAEAHGFLPIISPVTEPALDYGIAGAVAFLHRPPDWTLEGARLSFERGDRLRPPSVSVVAGGYTFNNSWFVGGGHLGIWREDRIRYVGFGGYGSFNFTMAGVTSSERDYSFDYNIEGWALTQSLKWRLADSNWLLGATWMLAGLTASFEAQELPDLEPFEKTSRNGSLGAILAYDSRDNIFTPSRGINASLEGKRYDDVLLGDYDYWEGVLSGAGYMGLGAEWVLGVRGKGARVGDGAPFWAMASVQMRGVPVQRYLGSSEAQAETELRWDMNPRWSLVGFGGLGWTSSTVREETLSRTVGAGGAGFRYLLARAFGLRGGLDLAYGPDGMAVYLTMGSAWR